jgi:hypothetical protein
MSAEAWKLQGSRASISASVVAFGSSVKTWRRYAKGSRPFALHVSTRLKSCAEAVAPAAVSEKSQAFLLGKCFHNRNYRRLAIMQGCSGLNPVKLDGTNAANGNIPCVSAIGAANELHIASV